MENNIRGEERAGAPSETNIRFSSSSSRSSSSGCNLDCYIPTLTLCFDVWFLENWTTLTAHYLDWEEEIKREKWIKIIVGRTRVFHSSCSQREHWKVYFETYEKKAGLDVNQITTLTKCLKEYSSTIGSMLNFAFPLFILIQNSAFSFPTLHYILTKEILSNFLCLIFYWLWFIFV
jgi:hypothetical protein